MYGNFIPGGLTLGKILGGISKSLNVANQIIPLYKEMKPVLGNAKKIISLLPDIMQKSSTNSASNNVKEAKIVNEDNNKKKTNQSPSNLSFFQ